MRAKTMIWEQCYEKSLTGFIVPESFRHPAKYSLALIENIFDHMAARGWIRPGDTIGDCFGGVAVGGVVATYRGFRWIGMELEPAFHKLALDNFWFHSPKWCRCDDENSNVYSLWQTLRAEHCRNKPKAPTQNGAVLQHGMPELFSLQGQEASEVGGIKNDGQNAMEQREALAEENAKAALQSGQQRKSEFGEKRELEGREIDQAGRIRGDSREGSKQNGACPRDGSAPWAKNEPRGSGSPQERNQDRQPDIESSSNDDRRAHAIAQHGKQQSQKAGKTCPACGRLRVYLPQIIQGDSRKFAERVSAVVTSPPYVQSLRGLNHNGIQTEKLDPTKHHTGQSSMLHLKESYGKSEGQIEKLSEGSVEACITSPPFCDSGARDKRKFGGMKTPIPKTKNTAGGGISNYGNTPGQISQLSAIATSPPWESNCEGGVRKSKLKAPPSHGKGHPATAEARAAQAERDEAKTYGTSAGNIGNTKGIRETCSVCGECLPLDLCQTVKIAAAPLPQNPAGAKNIIASTLAGRESRSQKNTKRKLPPLTSTCQIPSTTEKKAFVGPEAGQCGAASLGEFKGERRSPETATNAGDAGQKSALLFTTNEFQKTKKETGIIDSHHSKPYATLATLSTTGKDSSLRCCARCAESLISLAPQFKGLVLSHVEPPSTPQSTAVGEKEDYWRAMFKVYTQCYIALKPGGYMAVVVKAYVKNRKIVDLPGDTARLLEHCGFEMVERAHALLSEKTEHNDLFAGVTVTRRERKSFFKRLYEKDPKNPRIDWETVLFARKPL